MNSPSIAIIIVSWNVGDLLLRCLKSIPQAIAGDIRYHIVVADNASSDNTIRMVKRLQATRLRGKLTIIQHRQNIGFAAANNHAVLWIQKKFHQHPFDYYLFLNPDTQLLSPVVFPLLEAMERDPSIGVLGPTLFDEQGAIQRSVLRFPTPLTGLLVMLKVYRWFLWWKPMKRYLAFDFDYTKEQQVEQVQGAFFLVRRICWEQLGGFDAHFFVWFEEVDFCKRARAALWGVRYIPISGVIHHGAASFNRLETLKKHSYFRSSLLWYIAKHYGFAPWFFVWLLQPLGIFMAWASRVARPRIALCSNPWKVSSPPPSRQA